MPEPNSRGTLTIFLGYAAGVGKTYRMLQEARKLKAEGRDVVIGYFEPHGRVETIAQTEGLEFIGRRKFEYRGSVFEDMDTPALITRRPAVAAVDEFAHTNVPGAERPKRWQDVRTILDAGIDVLTSLNVQHIESLNDQVWQVTGIRVRETLPDWVVREADEVVMVDVTPRALVHRLERGVVYAPEKARVALENFFTETNLNALRELALRQAAQQLENRSALCPLDLSGLGPAERILLWLTPQPATAMLIRRARRVADYLGCPCTAIYAEEQEVECEPWLNICANLRIDVRSVMGAGGMPGKVAEYARSNETTQVFVTRETPEVAKLVHLARDLQITVVGTRVGPVR